MSAQNRMIKFYDRVMSSSKHRRYYDDSGFYNFGYWAHGAINQREASEALVDVLVARLPNREGPVLDVACGLGASTRRLTQVFPDRTVTAINISQAQLEKARINAPGATVLMMDAVRLEFPDASFSGIVCVEAAFHFNTREAFLREAFRVLKPGGVLVLSDILFRPYIAPVSARLGVPRANLASDIPSYVKEFQRTGYVELSAEDVTDATLGGFRRSLVKWPSVERARGTMSLPTSIGAKGVCRLISGYFAAVTQSYLLVRASKPG